MSTEILSFGIVITVQLVFFLGLATYWRYSAEQIARLLKISMLAGIPIGLFVDYVYGHVFDLYTYELGYGLMFILLNGIFSFGFMVATVGLNDSVLPAKRSKIKAANIMLGLAAVCYGAAWYWVDDFFLIRVLTGVSLLAVGEYLLLRSGFDWFTKRLHHVGCLVAMSICCGMLYEPVNFFFPVWVWNYGSMNFYIFELGVITFGYIGLGYVLYGALAFVNRYISQ